MVAGESKFRESIWSIHPKWRGWFYGVLSICGVAVSAFTLYDEWSKDWLEIFDEIRNGIVSSVIVVWFVFQVRETAMGAYQYFQDLKEQKLQKIRKEAEEQARKEARQRYDEALHRLKYSEEEIQKIHNLTSSVGPPTPPFPR